MPASDAATGLEILAERLPHYTTLRAYEKGDQPWIFATDAVRELFETLMRRYRLNVCRPVVRGVGRRLNIDTWDNPGAQEWWSTEGKRIQNRLWREMLRQGDGHTLTWPRGTMESGPLRTHRLRADEAVVVYLDDVPQFAVKAWLVEDGDVKHLRVNVYYPDRAERFWIEGFDDRRLDQVEASDLRGYQGDGDSDTAGDTIRYRGTIQAAGGDGLLPLQHFPCQPDDTPYGTSVLEDVLPVQDEINHIARTTLAAIDGYGLPLRIFTGMMVEEETRKIVDNETGEERWETTDNVPDYHPLKDYALWLPGENSKAVQLPEADLTKLLEVRRAAIQNATLASGVPLGLLAEDSGSVPSGVALRVIESPLTDLVMDLQQDTDVPIRNVARLHGFPEAAPSWTSPITFDDTERVEYALKLMETGLPGGKSLEVAGLMDADAFDEAVADAAEVDSELGSQLVRAFRDGADPADVLRR